MPTTLDYQRLVVAYHGCDAATARAVLLGEEELRPSAQPWDWLGNGIYFWEHGPERALDWAERRFQDKAAVIGAYVHLGVCFDLLDVRHTGALREAYGAFASVLEQKGQELPQNRAVSEHDFDRVRRELDCALINWSIDQCLETDGVSYQTVRGAFTEGGPAYPGAMIMAKTHIQIAVRDPDCILGYFRPR